MDFKIIFSVLSAVFGFGSFFPYIKEIFSGKTRPHIYTWFVWTFTQGIATIIAWQAGGGWGTLNLAMGTFLVFAIFIFSIKHGTKDITVFDTMILFLAFFAIFAWWKLDLPLLSVLLVSIADVLGYIPSYRKTWVDPLSESAKTWAGFSLASSLSILALSEYNFLTVFYLASILSANVLMFLVCIFRKKYLKLAN